MNIDNNRAVAELLKKPGNYVCADCGDSGPEWASYNIGIFICGRCAEIHQRMGPHISKVKHLTMDRWEDSQVQRMREIGNKAAKMKYEQKVPPSYRVPVRGDPRALIEEWIFAKYQREEFSRRERQLSGSANVFMEGYLMKRGKEDPRFFPRKFILSEEMDTLKYHVDERKDPKGAMKVSELSVSFAPEKLDMGQLRRKTSMQVSFPKDGGLTRHLFLYHEDPQTLISWYNAIRCARLHQLQVAFPAAQQSEGFVASNQKGLCFQSVSMFEERLRSPKVNLSQPHFSLFPSSYVLKGHSWAEVKRIISKHRSKDSKHQLYVTFVPFQSGWMMEK